MAQLITVEQLININRKPPQGWPRPSGRAIEEALKAANCTRPQEIVDFVEALSRMFGRIGMHGVCRLCFKGVLMEHRKKGANGCCGGCGILLEDRCANKPMGCARYMCAFTSGLFPRTDKFVQGIFNRVHGREGLEVHGERLGYYGGCYGGATERESHLKLTEASKRRLRWAIRKLDKWSERAL